MTLNYNLHREAIEKAYKDVNSSENGDKWVIYEYEGNSNTIKVGQTGNGGLEEFSESFSSGRLQFGVIAVRLNKDVLSKIVLIHWQGDGVPTLRLAATASHAEELRRFLKTVHIVIHARSEMDVDPDCIKKEVSKLPSTNNNSQAESNYVIPEKVGSHYEPVKPHLDVNNENREKFWKKMDEDEKKRISEEKKHREEMQKQYEADRKRMVNERSAEGENSHTGPGRVNSSFKPVRPQEEISSSAREEFWNKMNEEEKRRMEEEKKLKEEQRKRFEEERKRMENDIKSRANEDNKLSSAYKPVKPHVELNSKAREEFWNKMKDDENKRLEEEKALKEQQRKQFEEDRKRTEQEIQRKAEMFQVEKTAVGSVYKPTKPQVELSANARQEFWNKMNEEEQKRIEEEKKANLEKSKQYEVDQKRIENDIKAKLNLNDNIVKKDDTPSNNIIENVATQNNGRPENNIQPKPLNVIKNEEIDEKPTASLPQYDFVPEPPTEVSNVKNDEPPKAAPSNNSLQYDLPPVLPEDMKHSDDEWSDPPAPSHSKREVVNVPAIPTSQISSQYDMPPVLPEEPSVHDRYELPPVETAGLRAMALWDYQAADDTEISFDPDEIITDIDQVDSGWWKGRAPNGKIGLFPANYVKLL